VLDADDCAAPVAITLLLLHLGVFVAAAIIVLTLGNRRARLFTVKAKGA
jgi:hypothetical protein